jgi:hypothetical protein
MKASAKAKGKGKAWEESMEVDKEGEEELVLLGGRARGRRLQRMKGMTKGMMKKRNRNERFGDEAFFSW